MIGLKAKLIGAGVLVALLLGFVAHYYYIRTELTEARTELTEARSRVSTLEGAIAAERASMELRDDIVADIDEEYKNDVIQMEETLQEHADWSDSPVPSAVLRGLLTGSQD